MKEFAVIVAGGSGQRMNSSIPKQFLSLGDRPVLFHTLWAFWRYSQNLKIILVLPGDQKEAWYELTEKYDFSIPHQLVEGGSTRTDSVQNGLSLVPDESIVAIHDGVRPLVDVQIIRQSFEIARKSGSAIASVPPKDSIRKMLDDGSSVSADRSKFRLVQTPQTFQSSLIKEAYRSMPDGTFTDDASVLEATGAPVTLIEGSYSNIKITTPEDIAIAQALLNKIS